jgi:16S rRNA (guanine527-N7)-methyltransferase
VIDSLTGLAVLRERRVDRFVDLGSGGGFPGIPLAAALPADRALLIDSIGKKVRFLATVVDAVGLGDHVAAEPARAETLATSRADRGRWPAVTARAVAPLAELIELAFPLLQPGGVLVAWKRVSKEDPLRLEEEVAAGRRALVEAPVGAAPDLADLVDHRLVIVERGAGPVAATWPRDPATRRRQPW